MQSYAVFLSGPIGAGKTTIGRALAADLGAGFIDGDDHSDPNRPWYGSILRTSRSVVAAGLAILEARPAVVIAYPLSCSTWIFYRRHFGDRGVTPIFVSLRASYEAIVAPGRNRVFDDGERARIRVMVAEGYGERPFSDLIIDTDQRPLGGTVSQLANGIRRLAPSH